MSSEVFCVKYAVVCFKRYFRMLLHSMLIFHFFGKFGYEQIWQPLHINIYKNGKVIKVLYMCNVLEILTVQFN
jgi:hypothetical protein